MIAVPSNRGRPRGTLGPVARRVLALIVPSGMTTRDLAAAAQISRAAAKYTCTRLRDAGLLEDGGRVPVPGSLKRAILYKPAAIARPTSDLSLPSGFFAA